MRGAGAQPENVGMNSHPQPEPRTESRLLSGSRWRESVAQLELPRTGYAQPPAQCSAINSRRSILVCQMSE